MDSGIPVVVITLVVGCAVLALCLALFCCSKKLPRMLRPDAVSERYCRGSLRQNQVAQRPADQGMQRLIRTNSNNVNIEVLVSNPEQSRNRERRHSRRSTRIPSLHSSELPAIHRVTTNGPGTRSSIFMEVPTHGIVQSGPNRGMIIPVTTQIREVWLPRLSTPQRQSVVPVQAPVTLISQQVPPPGGAREHDAPPTYEEAMRMCPPRIHHI